MKKYRWVAESNDRSFEDESRQEFTSKEECYNDMRNAALEKMKWNTEYEHDFNDCESIEYGVTFYQERIIHASYSGVYTYEIKEVKEMKTIELTEEQKRMISAAINSVVQDIEKALLLINQPMYDEIKNIEIERDSMTEYKLKYQTLLNYIKQV